MHISEKVKPFNCCPACGSGDIVFDENKKIICRECAFTYFHNVAAAVGAILEYDGKIVLIKRAKEPGRGMLDLPGGFIDPNESAEEAVVREVKEEINIDIREPEYLGSFPNIYKYQDVLYHTCDLFFYCRINVLPVEFSKTEVEELVLLRPSEIPADKIAFDSVGLALEKVKSQIFG
jgi:NAD+ diphosphatase